MKASAHTNSGLRFTVLMYHSVDFGQDHGDTQLTCPPPLFDKQMGFLRSTGCPLFSLTEIYDRLARGEPVPQNTVAVTLDDGFQNNYDNAYPVLRKYHIPATIFLVSSLVGKTGEWMTGSKHAPLAMLSWEQIREMRANGVEFGAHSVSHPRLTDLDVARAREEIVASKAEIEAGLGEVIKHFAYPFGNWNETVRELVRQAGFATACTTVPGFNNGTTDAFLLRRIEVTGTDTLPRFRRKITFGTNEAHWSVAGKYYGGRLASKIIGKMRRN